MWPGRSAEGGRADYWRRGHLYENGDFLAMFDNLDGFSLIFADTVIHRGSRKVLTFQPDIQSIFSTRSRP